jgi:AhpD family alkylhydroperoxidase
MAFISPPTRFPFWLRLGLWVARRVGGQDFVIGRLLGWYPPAAFSSGILEALIVHRDGELNARLLQLVRLQVSYAAACPFCVGMNSRGHEQAGISAEEIEALRGRRALDSVTTFSERERLALEYARLITQTPLKFRPDFIETLKRHFTERELVILATTAAQVNYWTRLIQALGVPAAE